jgi:hypothetical protein
LQLTLKPSPGRSRSGAQETFGTLAGAITGMGGVATITGARLDPTIIVDLMGLAIIVDLVGLAIMVDLAVLAIMAVIADQLALPVIVATGSVLACRVTIS